MIFYWFLRSHNDLLSCRLYEINVYVYVYVLKLYAVPRPRRTCTTSACIQVSTNHFEVVNDCLMSSKWFQFNHVCNWFNYDFVFALFALYCLTSNLFCFFWFTFSIIFQCVGAGLMQKSLQRFCVCVFHDFSKIGFTCLTL